MEDLETREEDIKQKHQNENIRNLDQKTSKEITSLNHTIGSHDSINYVLLMCILGVTLGISLKIMNKRNDENCIRKKVWAYEKNINGNGTLKHVYLVLERVGFEKSSNTTPWDLLWSHDYPFTSLYPTLNRLKPHQKVNHFPGIGFLTYKVNLATTDSKYIPKAFKLPKEKEDFLKYASENKNIQFLEKNNNHRGVHLKNVSAVNYDGKFFVQQFLPNPFLVDGFKFDIGLYVVVTSVNPLRLYWYKGDVLFRYCNAKYYPLDPNNRDQYVILSEYRSTWQVPSLAHAHSVLGTSMKDAFDLYAESKGKNTTKMWEDIHKAIVEIFLKKVHLLINALKPYSSQDNFFELLRVDFIVDDALNVYMLEANMSPNLVAENRPANQLLYEQVLYSLFSITGIANENLDSDQATKDMVSSQKNIAVWAKECSTTCKDQCEDRVCKLCQFCINRNLKQSLLRAHREFLHRADFRRLFPPPMKQGHQPNKEELKNLTESDSLQYLWFQGKCNTDITWCT